MVIASLLCVFVPQACSIEESKTRIYESTFGTIPLELTGHLNGTKMTTHICTFQENFTNLIDYNTLLTNTLVLGNTFVLAFNFLTLGYFIYLYKV